MLDQNWKRSGRCDNSGPNCVEAKIEDGAVLVRDSKNPDGAPLSFTPAEWTAFVAGVKDGEFNI